MHPPPPPQKKTKTGISMTGKNNKKYTAIFPRGCIVEEGFTYLISICHTTVTEPCAIWKISCTCIHVDCTQVCLNI